MSQPAAIDRVDAETLDVLNGLGAAWLTHQLYPDPTAQPPFLRAVDLLTAHAGNLPPVGVGPGLFIVQGVEVQPERDGVEKLARQLFVHDVEWIEFVGEAVPQGLAAFFSVIATDEETVEAEGGIAASLVGAPSAGIRVKQRGLLNLVAGEGHHLDDEDVDATADLDMLSPLAAIAMHGAEAHEIAAAVVEDADEVDEGRATDYIDAFHELGEQIDRILGDPSGTLLSGIRIPADDPYRTVRTFIESFFQLPRWLQVEVIERVLAEMDRPDHQMFLDQFSGHDLMDLMGDLSDTGTERLLAYAVEASSEGSGHPLDLLAGLSSAVEVEASRKSVADRVSAVVSAAKQGVVVEDLAAIRTEMEAAVDPLALERIIIRGLLECEERRDRFQRAARVWTGRVTRHVRNGDLAAAAGLLAGVLDDPPYPPARQESIAKALERMTTADLFRRLSRHEEGEEEHVAVILDRIGRIAVDQLVHRLAEEEDATKRRALVDLLAVAARRRPDELEPYLSDPRWYLVRNLVTALGGTANRDAIPGVRVVLDHSDHRVRMEALRAMVKLAKSDAAPFVVRALGDDHERVRTTAVALIKGTELDDVERLVAAELRADRLPVDAALAAIAILGDRTDPMAIAVIDELASRRFVFGSRRRTLRTAARAARDRRAP